MRFALILFFVVGLSACSYAQIITGTLENFPDSGIKQFGDGNNHVTLFYSQNINGRGWFYGDNFTGDSEVAFAGSEITDVTQITNAESLTYFAESIGPHCDSDCDPEGSGDFLVWRNKNTGYYGALRVDDIVFFPSYIIQGFQYPDTWRLNATWYFQTNGTGDFSNSTIFMLGDEGDINRDGIVSFLDIAPFVEILSINGFQFEADIDQSGAVDILDIPRFVELLRGQ